MRRQFNPIVWALAVPALGGFLLVSLATTCGGPGTTPGPLAEGEMDESVREAAIIAANAKFESLLTIAPAEARQQMLDYLNSRPEFQNASIQGTEVAARFTDGVSMVFINNRLGDEAEGAKGLIYVPGNDPPPPPSTPPPPVMRDGKVSRAQYGIPFNPSAYLVSSMGPGFINADVGVLAGFVASHGYGLMSGGGRAGVDELRTNVQNAGIFYINSHGGVSLCAESDAPTFCVWTDTISLESLRREFWESELKPCNLVIASAPYTRVPVPGIDHVQSHFAFTGNFVRAHMSFCPDSFVYIDSCHSQSTAAADLKSAFFEKGASIYAGWTDVVIDKTAGPATSFIFDRMLGGNNPGIYPEDPNQRPFNYGDVLNDMRQRNPRLDTAVNDDGRTPFLLFSGPNPDNNSDFGLLAPSIRYLVIDQYKNELLLYGRFGYQQGRVTVGGDPVTVKSWEPDLTGLGQMKIVCDLPEDAFGDVTVFVDNRRSNTYQISMWELKLIAKDTLINPNADGQIDLEVHVTLKFRACLNNWRDKPHKDPVKLGTIATALSKKSTGMVVATGYQHTPPNPITHMGEITVTAHSPDPQNWIVVNQVGDGEEDDFQIESVSYVQAGDVGPGLNLHLEVGGHWDLEQDDDFHGDFCCAHPPTGLATNAYFDTSQPVQLPMDDKFNIKAGKMNARDGGGSTFEWEAASAQAPPSDQAAR